MFGKKLAAGPKPTAAPKQFTTKVGAPPASVVRAAVRATGGRGGAPTRAAPTACVWPRLRMQARRRSGGTWQQGVVREQHARACSEAGGGWEHSRQPDWTRHGVCSQRALAWLGECEDGPRARADTDAASAPSLRMREQLEGFSVGEEDCGMMGGNCGQRLFSTRPNRVSVPRARARAARPVCPLLPAAAAPPARWTPPPGAPALRVCRAPGCRAQSAGVGSPRLRACASRAMPRCASRLYACCSGAARLSCQYGERPSAAAPAAVARRGGPHALRGRGAVCGRAFWCRRSLSAWCWQF